MVQDRSFKVALVCSHGGHLTEMKVLWPAFEGHDCFLVTYRSPRTEGLNLVPHKYLLPNIGTSATRMVAAARSAAAILRRERPDLVMATGAEIAIPFLWLARLMRAKTIFVESWCRVHSRSLTGRVVYPIVDAVLVMWPTMLQVYGRKAKYLGPLL